MSASANKGWLGMVTSNRLQGYKVWHYMICATDSAGKFYEGRPLWQHTML